MRANGWDEEDSLEWGDSSEDFPPPQKTWMEEQSMADCITRFSGESPSVELAFAKAVALGAGLIDSSCDSRLLGCSLLPGTWGPEFGYRAVQDADTRSGRYTRSWHETQYPRYDASSVIRIPVENLLGENRGWDWEWDFEEPEGGHRGGPERSPERERERERERGPREVPGPGGVPRNRGVQSSGGPPPGLIGH